MALSQQSVIGLAIAVLLLPLLGFVLTIFFGKKLPRNGDWLETGLSRLLSFSHWVLTRNCGSYGRVLSSGSPRSLLNTGPGLPLTIALGFGVDNLAAIMLLVVTLVSTSSISTGYMHDDTILKILAYRNFVLDVLIVLVDNLFMLYVGWELVGLSSCTC
jgi:NADH-quinone oxidoreductase subunit L